MKILCLHGFRTSGSFLQKQISKWDSSAFADHFHMEFPEGIYPAARGKSEIVGIFPPPYFERYPDDKGAILSALLLDYQIQGRVLKDHPPIKLFVSISGAKFWDPRTHEIAYGDPINVRSVHFIGAKDWLRLPSQELATAFHNPLIINHPQGHAVPKLDENTTEKLRKWTKEILLHYGSIKNGEAKVDDTKSHEVNHKIPVMEKVGAKPTAKKRSS